MCTAPGGNFVCHFTPYVVRGRLLYTRRIRSRAGARGDEECTTPVYTVDSPQKNCKNFIKIGRKFDFSRFFQNSRKFLTSMGPYGQRRTLPLTRIAFPENLVTIGSTVDFWQNFQKVVHLAFHRGRHCPRRPFASHGGTRHIHLNNHRKFHQIISNRSRLIETDILLQVQSFPAF